MKFLLLAALALAAPAAAQAPNWAKGTPIAITVTNDRFIPARITLRQGAAYILRFRNPSSRKHNFSAPAFFKYARVSPRDAAWVRDNAVTLDPGATATVHVIAPDTPSAAYDFRSTRIGDAGEKMKGKIYVR